MNGKSLMKHDCLEKKSFVATFTWRILKMQIECMQKEFVKTLIKQLRKYHDLWLKSDVLVLADVFESFRKMCLESYQSDATIFFKLQD